eukprot:sb/3465910/
MDFTSGLCNETGDIDLRKVVQLFYDRGILLFKDDRLKTFVNELVEVESSKGLGSRAMHTVLKVSVPKEEFELLVENNPFAKDVLTNSLVIPDFQDFSREVESAFLAEAEERSGEITTYIPGLSKYSLDNWAISFCSTDGQVMALGDYKERFTIQSCTKPLLYGIACDMVGIDKVHKHVGKEPSGFGFNKIALGHGDKPHNPLINIGAITVASLIRPEENSSERFETCYSKYNALAAGIRTRSLSFNNAVYLSERESGHRNYAIGHYLVNKGCIEGTTSSLTEVLELYFQLCSIEADVRAVSVMGATLANGGKNVFTGKNIEQLVTQSPLQLVRQARQNEYKFYTPYPRRESSIGGQHTEHVIPYV